MYRSSAGVVPRGRPLNPSCSRSLKLSPKVVKRCCCEQFRTLQPHFGHTAASSSNYPMIRLGKSIQMSSNRLIIRHFSLRQQLGGIFNCYTACNLFGLP
ncbi:hypothetical protein TNCV_3444011 [Trichonephila clavipes]|nr:hypothetical protein TNCV_3444011 [Trichonephila clavipes]